MLNGNKFMSIENDLNLINKKIEEGNRNEKNYHYINNKKRDFSYDIIRKNDEQNNKNIFNLKNNRQNSCKKEYIRNFPNFLCNIDLNKLPTYNNCNDENNKNSLLLNNNDDKDISPEKYLEDILAGNENDIIVSLDNKNYLTSNIFKSSKEFDILKNTLFHDRNMNKLSKSLQITKQNNQLNQNESEPNLNKEKIINHDDIPIVVNNTNFMDLLEKELANENIYNLKYNNKSWDISKNKNSCNLSENSLNNQQNFLNKKENYDRDDYDNKEKIKYTKIINNKKNDLIDKRSRTPDNSSFKKANKRKIFKNNNININNINNNIIQANINTENKQNITEKENNINKNIIHNNKYMNPLQQRKIKNIINNNSITIISHFDIEENSIKKNQDIYNNNLEIKELNDSTDKDITNYMCEEDEEKEKKELVQKRINELNYEINKYKEERNNLNKTKMLYEKLKSKLSSDIEIFNKQKEEFKKYIINELEKIKIKQQKYKSNNKIIKNLKTENEILTRKNQESKEVIESLKNQISQLQKKIKNINVNNNFFNKKTSNYNFQYIDEKNNNSSLRRFLTKEDNNNNDTISHRVKLYRNRSSLGINKNKAEKLSSERRLNTFMTEKDIYSIKTNTKQDESFEIHNANHIKKINIINGEKKIHSSKVYKIKNIPDIKTPINIIENINEKNNIITKEKYNNILKLINNSFKKGNYRNSNDKSFIERINELELNHIKDETTKKILKCKSNININPNQNKNRLQQQNVPKKPLKNTDRNQMKEMKEKKLSLEDYDFKIPEKYINQKYKLTKTLKAGDKIIKIYDDNKKEILFPSGVRKEIFKDGYQIIYFVNGDIKQNHPNGKSIYYFKQAKTVQTTFKNGIFVVKFENNQVEKHYPNGKKQILFPDGSEKIIFDNGNEQSLYSEENSSINNL